MRMLQSQGPVNFEIAQQVATAVATANAETGEPEAEPPIDPAMRASFDDVVRAAQGQRRGDHRNRRDARRAE